MTLPDRSIRIFISSTFRDMQIEREYLIKNVFPRLRALCESRGIIWAEVDLRWGIPEDEQAEARVLPICLEEVERCRPFFIGILGERYGSILPIIAPEVIAQEPWLGQPMVQGKSATELEIIHGVLDGPATAGRFLYFRDPQFLDHLPAGSDRVIFESDTSEAACKLAELKERIRTARDEGRCRLREDYRDAEQLGEWIEADLRALIEQLFLRDMVHNTASATHARFAAERQRLWVGRELELQQLTATIADSRAVLVVAPPGGGRSAFLANWAAIWRKKNPDVLVVEHYADAHPDASSLNACCRELCLRLAEVSGQPPPSNSENEDWINIFDEQLATTALVKPLLLIIDGADRVQGSASHLFPDWLPEELPDRVRILASADEPVECLAEERSWPVLHLAGLRSDDRVAFIKQYLTPFGKELSTDNLQQIALAPATANPFYLTLILEELRQHGDHKIAERIAELLAAHDICELCGLIFRRCERDYGGNITARALSLLATARAGLSDVELCELIGGPEGRLPQRSWSRLQLALRKVLVSREGAIVFAQREALRAARREYCAKQSERRALHREIADYFLERLDSQRAVLEVPFHLQRLKQWDELANWLGRADTIATAWRIAPDMVISAWRAVEKNSQRHVVDACVALPAALRAASLTILRRLGHWPEALTLARQIEKEAESQDDSGKRIEVLLTTGAIELEAGAPKYAQLVFEQAEEAATDVGDQNATLHALHGQMQAIRRQAMVARGSVSTRAHLGRQLRIVRDRALRIAKTTADQCVQAEELLMWLEDLVSQGLTMETIRDYREVLTALFSAEKRESLADKVQQAVTKTETRLGRLDEIVAKLRHTRYRGLALRARVALAKAREDEEELWFASIALRQYAAARQDYKLLAETARDCAQTCEGDTRLFFLQEEGRYLGKAAQLPDLVRNWWKQAELLWPELGRRSEALDLARRVSREVRSIPKWSDRQLFQLYRIRLFLQLGSTQFLARAGLWTVGPLWLWVGWEVFVWVKEWFFRYPFVGVIAYLLSFIFFVLPALIMLSEVCHGLAWMYRGVFCQSDKEKYSEAAIVSSNELHAESSDSPLVNQEPPPIQEDGGCRGEDAPLSNIPEDPPFEIPKFLSKFFEIYTRMARKLVRIERIGRALRWERPRAQFAWLTLAGLVGFSLTAFYWRQSGWSRMCLVPIGIAGQVLLLEAISVAVLSVSRRYLKGRMRSSPTRVGSPISFACLLGLLRLRRRIFGRRRLK